MDSTPCLTCQSGPNCLKCPARHDLMHVDVAVLDAWVLVLLPAHVAQSCFLASMPCTV